ncbi:MAG TPA: right-handed parallel beta-helix repeat-containing protein [Pyrinomonadaceae bacterium]|nr:right-handed parallel beta-helix repeat-containing protein [Pyrinomonadaceae bacterium]
MKRCPACDRTYSDEAALNFCLDDGAALLRVEPASFSSQETLRIPAARETEQGRTDVLYPQAPTVNPAQSYRPTPYTPPQPGSYGQAATMQRRSGNPWPWIIAIAALLLIGFAGVAGFVVYTMLRTPIIIVSKGGGGQYTTIAEAIKNAKSGTRIMVRPGFYNEGFAIDKQVEIVGDGPLRDIVVESKDTNCIRMQTEQATVRGLTLRARTAPKEFFAIDIPRGQLTLEDCDITSDTLAAVAVHGSLADAVMRRTRIHDGKAGGVFIFDHGSGTVEDCDIYGNVNAAVEIKDGSNATVRRSKLYDNKASGVFVWKNSKGTIEECDIYGNDYAGITIGEYAAPTITKCRIHDCKAGGIFIYDHGKGTIEDTDISATVYAGIEIKDGSDPVVRRCKISESKVSGIFVWKNSKGTIENCEIFKNAFAGVATSEGGNPTVRRCKINDNGYQAVWAYSNGAGTVQDSDLTGNDRGPWLIETGSSVSRSGNTE